LREKGGELVGRLRDGIGAGDAAGVKAEPRGLGAESL
jgi:hypothetical protein